MADSDKLIGKVDALLGRHRASVKTAEPPADFPVLTEVVKLADAVPVALSDDETRLRDAILASLAPELEQRLAEPLRKRADELLDQAMQTMRLEFEATVKAAVRSAVAKAIDEALVRRRDEPPASGV